MVRMFLLRAWGPLRKKALENAIKGYMLCSVQIDITLTFLNELLYLMYLFCPYVRVYVLEKHFVSFAVVSMIVAKDI